MPDPVAKHYPWYQRLHYHLNWNVSRVIVHTQAEFADLRTPLLPSGFSVGTLDPSDPHDASLWADLVNSAYGDADGDPNTLYSYWATHPQFVLRELVGVFEGSNLVATVASGVYRADPTVGGGIRAAVHPTLQSAGLGAWLFAEALARTQNYGAQRVEALTMVHRERSLRVQFRVGLLLQEDYSKVIPTGQKRRWPARELALHRARRVRDQFYAEHPELR